MKLKELREKANLRQEEIANIIKISKNGYCNYENKKRKIPHDVLENLANYYNVTIDFLIGREFLGGQQITEEEYELLELFRQLTGSEQKRLIGYAKFQTSMEENLQENKKISAK